MRLRPRFLWGRYRVLEPDEAKVSSPVLGGLAPSNGGGLLGTREDLSPRSPFGANFRIIGICTVQFASVEICGRSLELMNTPSGPCLDYRQSLLYNHTMGKPNDLVQGTLDLLIL